MPDDTRTRCFGSPEDPLMMSYHDNEWGVPVHDDRKQFEFLCLESMQSGLSWKTILDKRENFRKAFSSFDPVKVAAYTDADIERLMSDAGIVRNRRKIEAIVNNAQRFLEVSGRSSAPSTATSGISLATRPCVGTTSVSPRPDPRVRGPCPRTSTPEASSSWAPSSSTPTCRPPARSTTTTRRASVCTRTGAIRSLSKANIILGAFTRPAGPRHLISETIDGSIARKSHFHRKRRTSAST